MEVYTLVGKSGTGKSFHSMNLCKRLGIEAIIDDGLFIYKNRVIAGTSAKKENTYIGAVKTALFHKDENRDQVAEAIKRENPESILILGTSDGMVNKIMARLGIPVLPEDSPYQNRAYNDGRREKGCICTERNIRETCNTSTFYAVKKIFLRLFYGPAQVFPRKRTGENCC